MRKRRRPRPLRLLRIDDDLTVGGNPKAPGYRAQRAPGYLETVELGDSGQTKPGIGSWADAISFWKQHEGIPDIDLVISDVRFDDSTSPIVNGWNLPRGAWLPTGLSHFKAFAALARITGRPFGVGLHTKEPRIWRRLSSEVDPFRRIMGNLAAHEIGELAALLGEGAEVGLDTDSCWSWLERRTFDATDFREAVPSALESYRKSLGMLKLLPGDYEAMVRWCGRMEASGAETGTTRPIDDETDEGFPLYLSDGSRPLLSIRSLFTDVLLTRQRFQFEREGLPAEAFQLLEDEEFYKLDENGNPKIGALVYQCGDYGRAFQKALETLDQFPPPPGRNAPFTLANARENAGADWLATALAVLFQDVKREWELYTAWRALYEEHEWHPITDAFGEPTLDKSMTLQSWLHRVSSQARASQSISHEEIMEMFEAADYDRDDTNHIPETVDEVADEDIWDDPLLPDEIAEESEKDCTEPAKRRGWPGTRRCIQLLRDMEVLTYAPGTGRYVPGQHAFSVGRTPPVPKRPPQGFMQLTGLGPALGTDEDRRYKPQAALRNTFGYGKDDSNSIVQRAVHKGLGLANDTEGREFIEAFREGRPWIGWVKEAARDYARYIGWRDVTSWPDALRY